MKNNSNKGLYIGILVVVLLVVGISLLKSPQKPVQTADKNVPPQTANPLPPDAPTGLTVLGNTKDTATTSKVALGWHHSPADVGGNGVGVVKYVVSLNGVPVNNGVVTPESKVDILNDWYNNTVAGDYAYVVTGLTPGTPYTFSVVAVDNLNTPSAPITVSATSSSAYGDFHMATLPKVLSITNPTADGGTVTWQGSTDDTWVMLYRVYYQTGSGNSVQRWTLHCTKISQNSCKITGLSAHTTYNIGVLAKDLDSPYEAISSKTLKLVTL